MCKVFNTLHQNTLGSIYQISKKNTSSTCKVFNTLHLNTLGSIYPNSKKYFFHMQSIQYFAPKYLGVHISNFEKILLARAKYSILCTWIPGGPYIQLQKNTSCTCKVFNTLHLDTLGSIYPTSKKYFLYVQGIQYFAPKYLGVHLSNFKKILLAHTKYSILCTYIPGGPYIQLRKIHLACAKYSILCT